MNEPAGAKPFLVAAALLAILVGTSCPSSLSHMPGPESEPLTWVPPAAMPRVPSGLGALIEGAQDADEAYAGTQRLLADTTDPVHVGYLLSYCHWKARTTHWRDPQEEGVIGPLDRGEWYSDACGACLHRLSEMGKHGNDEAIRQLVFVLTEVDHDAAFSEEIGQAFCLIGEPAIPFLQRVEGKQHNSAQNLVHMIRKGEPFF